jgi:major type 1 subunit fimbrin (pilin)
MTRINSLSVLAGVCTLTLASQAFATDGTINFTGSLTASTCKINGNAAGTATTEPVTLPTLAASSLTNAGSTAGATPFALNLTDCTGSTAQTKFEVGSTVDASTGALINQSTDTQKSNVQVQILNNQMQAINLYTNENSQTASLTGDDGTKSGTLQYYAQYYAPAAAATAGSVSTSVTFSMLYN